MLVGFLAEEMGGVREEARWGDGHHIASMTGRVGWRLTVAAIARDGEGVCRAESVVAVLPVAMARRSEALSPLASDVLALASGVSARPARPSAPLQVPSEHLHSVAYTMSNKAALIVPAIKRHTSTVIVAHGLGDR